MCATGRSDGDRSGLRAIGHPFPGSCPPPGRPLPSLIDALFTLFAEKLPAPVFVKRSTTGMAMSTIAINIFNVVPPVPPPPQASSSAGLCAEVTDPLELVSLGI